MPRPASVAVLPKPRPVVAVRAAAVESCTAPLRQHYFSSVSRMSAPNDSTPQPKVARSRFQFSLRVLLVAFTLFAIGFPIWYRWPYEEHVNEPNTLGDRQTIIWQRQWGGERLQVGKRFYSKDRLILTMDYQDGELHGEWKRFHNDGTIKESRQYFEGKKHGAWVEYSPNGQPRSLSTYHRGKLHGLWEMEQFDGTILRLRFDLGRLTSINNLQPHERLIELLDRGTIDSDRVAAALRSNSMLEFIEESTETIAFHAGDTHGIIIVADPRTARPAPPLTINIETDLATALTIVAQHGGFECDYRYGCVWITEANGIMQWSDPTGVSQIQPADGTPLAGAWRELVSACRRSSPNRHLANTGVGAWTRDQCNGNRDRNCPRRSLCAIARSQQSSLQALFGDAALPYRMSVHAGWPTDCHPPTRND